MSELPFGVVHGEAHWWCEQNGALLSAGHAHQNPGLGAQVKDEFLGQVGIGSNTIPDDVDTPKQTLAANVSD